MLNDPEALESMMKEWKGQWAADVYDFKDVREYDDVVKEASKKGEEIHMAIVEYMGYVWKTFRTPQRGQA